MKVLFVSMVGFENNTSASIQNKGIIKGLKGMGHVVDTLTLKPNHNTISYDDSMNDINSLVEKSYYIDINPVYAMLMAKKQKPNKEKAICKNENSSILKYMLGKVRFIIKKLYDNIAIFDAQKWNVNRVSQLDIDYNKYDVIISASDPKSSHLIVQRIFKKNKNLKVKWIQYWGDPMLIDITRKSDWRDRFVKYEENKLISKANRVVYASFITLKKQREIFPEFSFKMNYASQSYANEVNADTIIIDKGRKESAFIKVGYFGAYESTVRNIIPLYNAAKGGNFILNICGVSDIILKSENMVSVYGVVPYKKAVEMEKQSDILVCICNSKGTQIPGKIYYCTSYKKPIIVVLDGEYKDAMKHHFEKFNRFVLCDNEEESIKKAVKKAKNQLKTNNFIISKRLTPKYMARRILGN